jgi:hypothetical protein
MSEGAQLCLLPCFTCEQHFSTEDPERVPSVWIDPATKLPPDLGGDATRAKREPLCPTCFGLVLAQRAGAGAQPWPPPPGGWPAEYAKEIDRCSQ